MKTLIKPLLVALSFSVLVATMALPAAATPTKPIGRPASVATYKTGIYTSNTGRLNIALEKETGGAVDIRLKSADGSVLYSQHLGKNERSTRTRLNLTELTDGVYQLEITNGVETTRQTVTISTKQPATPGRLIQMEPVASN